MSQPTQSRGLSRTVRWPAVGLVGAVVLVWAGQAGTLSVTARAICRRQRVLAWVLDPVSQPKAFAAATDTPEQNSSSYRASCWAGQLPSPSSIPVADWSFRATIIGVGGLHGP